MQIGKITQVMGPVVDVHFDETMPAIGRIAGRMN